MGRPLPLCTRDATAVGFDVARDPACLPDPLRPFRLLRL